MKAMVSYPENIGSGQTAVDNNNAIPQDQAVFEADKRAVYKHPLFPLLALLFERCEQATQSAETPNSESFNMDIQAFVQHQERDRKPFLINDAEVDGLMIKAIQVLRIHLLELEKVQELCKDFCNRYITCLKGKMQSENLLRSDYATGYVENNNNNSSGHSSDSSSPLAHSPHHLQVLSSTGAVGGVCEDYVLSNPAMPPLSPAPTPVLAPAPPVLGSTPLSQIGANPFPSPCESTLLQGSLSATSGGSGDEDDDYFGSKKKQKRGVLPKHATSIMRAWLFAHLVHPYPTEDEKRQIAAQTNLTLLQVNNWFINARRRILQPMLDASTPSDNSASEQGGSGKKSKSNGSGNASSKQFSQKFWSENIGALQQFALENTQDSSTVSSDESDADNCEVGSGVEGTETGEDRKPESLHSLKNS
ncbi:unnamed protein product [Bemisia tabaci]|uniref:Homeobox domain-containing protein n=1 Tax=Bemisia tabaci TaxID=7038 RepID=A0A9P0EXX5_BEMTA|nr:unnamed protein product [Bemisia tabaci]